jgi:hypothetical protein
MTIKLFDEVALTEDIPEENLKRGQVGYVIEILEPGVFEVEFSDRTNGHTYAELPVKADQLMALYFQPLSE